MTIKELIKLLENQEHQDRPVEVSIGQYNKVYPIAYCEIERPTHDTLQTDGHKYRIEISLPKSMRTSTRKHK